MDLKRFNNYILYMYILNNIIFHKVLMKFALYSLIKWSFRCGHKRGHMRNVGKQFIPSADPRKTESTLSRGSHLREAPGECASTPWTSAFVGVMVEYTRKKYLGGFFWWIECHQGTVSWGHRGKVVTGTSLSILVHLVTWEGCSEAICGDVKAAGK